MAGSLVELYEQLQEQMDELRDGAAIASAATAVLAELPAGALALLSTSDRGAGLAAVCASHRTQPTTWGKVDLILPIEVPPKGEVVFIEPVDPGAGWREAVERRFPGARAIVLSEIRYAVPAAA